MAGGTRFLSADEVAAETGLSRAQVYRAIARGVIPSVRVGRRVLVERSKLDDFYAAGGEAA